ncbi:MAG: hypothetical protein ACERKV_05020 [Clostridiaceae bacterium]
MIMDAIGNKGVNTSNYTLTCDTKKLDSKNSETSDGTTSQGIIKNLECDTYVKSTEEDTVNLIYAPEKKKLSLEEVKTLKAEQENVKADFIKKFISDTISNQNKLFGKSNESVINEMSEETTDLITKIFGSVENAYPAIETTAEGAEKAIGEDGAYSKNAVADRIMTMAKFIAGDDPDKLQQMREAVEKGFSEAGLVFEEATKSELPQICKDTCTEVMRRFDEL